MAKEPDAMRARIEALERQIAELTGRVPHERDIPLEDRPDYIAHGSEKHVAFLGLREATPEETARAEKQEAQGEIGLAYQGYVLQDITAFGVTAKAEMLKAILMQKVHQLKPPPAPQSDDPLAPNYAPPLWVPSGIPVSGVVGSG